MTPPPFDVFLGRICNSQKFLSGIKTYEKFLNLFLICFKMLSSSLFFERKTNNTKNQLLVQ